MWDVLKNIFEPDKPRTSYARVVRRVSAGRYELEDDCGRLSVAECGLTDFYPAGVSVIVQSGRIIGRGSRSGSHTVRQV